MFSLFCFSCNEKEVNEQTRHFIGDDRAHGHQQHPRRFQWVASIDTLDVKSHVLSAVIAPAFPTLQTGTPGRVYTDRKTRSPVGTMPPVRITKCYMQLK